MKCAALPKNSGDKLRLEKHLGAPLKCSSKDFIVLKPGSRVIMHLAGTRTYFLPERNRREIMSVEDLESLPKGSQDYSKITFESMNQGSMPFTEMSYYVCER